MVQQLEHVLRPPHMSQCALQAHPTDKYSSGQSNGSAVENPYYSSRDMSSVPWPRGHSGWLTVTCSSSSRDPGSFQGSSTAPLHAHTQALHTNTSLKQILGERIEMESYYEAVAVLELNSEIHSQPLRSTCLRLLSAGIKGLHHHTWLLEIIFKNQKKKFSKNKNIVIFL